MSGWVPLGQSLMGVAIALVLLSLLVETVGKMQYETVTTKSGSLRGFRTSKCTKFLGIPYATAERFSNPRKVQPWPGTRDATMTGPMCYQHCPPMPTLICQKRMSENCLFLNIYRPLVEPDSDEKTKSYAVMVFIHGGNFESYSGGSQLFDGEVFVSMGKVILVTLNYRLGPFGFLATVEDKKMTSGNFGLEDQKLALEWIHDNIDNFGGNKSTITIFGQSAGAQSVVLHLLSSTTRELFQQVIIQSCPFTLAFRNLEEASKQMRKFSIQLGCEFNNLNCYRNKTANDILVASDHTTKKFSKNFLMRFEPFGPTMDGKDIPRSLLDGIEKSQKVGKNIIIGTNTHEGALYASSILPANLPLPLGFIMISTLLPRLASGIHTLYSKNKGTMELLTNVITDYIFYCSSRRFADLVTTDSDKLWFYIFSQPLSFPAFSKKSTCSNKACHGGELPFLFDTPSQNGINVTDEDQILSKRMIYYWTNFAKYGTVNKIENKGHLIWQNFENTPKNGNITLYFAEPDLKSKEADRGKICNFFNKMGYHFSHL